MLWVSDLMGLMCVLVSGPNNKNKITSLLLMGVVMCVSQKKVYWIIRYFQFSVKWQHCHSVVCQ